MTLAEVSERGQAEMSGGPARSSGWLWRASIAEGQADSPWAVWPLERSISRVPWATMAKPVDKPAELEMAHQESEYDRGSDRPGSGGESPEHGREPHVPPLELR